MLTTQAPPRQGIKAILRAQSPPKGSGHRVAGGILGTAEMPVMEKICPQEGRLHPLQATWVGG